MNSAGRRRLIDATGISTPPVVDIAFEGVAMEGCR